MRLMRCLTWCAASGNFIIIAKHIPGINNNIAGALSGSRPADSHSSQHLGRHSNLASAHALRCDVGLGSVVGHLWDRSINFCGTLF